MIEISEKDLETYADKFNVIMLSPDATQVLENLNKTSAYVIGGLVDRTRKKSLSLNRALEKNLCAYRLPIEEENIVVILI